MEKTRRRSGIMLCPRHRSGRVRWAGPAGMGAPRPIIAAPDLRERILQGEARKMACSDGGIGVGARRWITPAWPESMVVTDGPGAIQSLSSDPQAVNLCMSPG